MKTRLKNLFDYQRFERNPKLQQHISAVEEKYQIGDILSDDALEMVSAGKGMIHYFDDKPNSEDE